MLFENRIGGQYPKINQFAQQTALKELFIDDNCCVFTIHKSKYTVLLFPLDCEIVNISEKKQKVGFNNSEFIIKTFVSKRLKKFNLNCNKVIIIKSNTNFKGLSCNYITCVLEQDKFKDIFYLTEDIFKYFSQNFKDNLQKLTTHLLDDNPFRYKYIY